MRKLFVFSVLLLFVIHVRAQEMRCAVSVNYQKLQSTTQQYESADTKVFGNMKQALEDFINARRWTTLEMEQNEKLDCSLSLILNKRTSATDFEGQLSIQLRRPIYNSNYTSGLFNYMESGDFKFTYNESQSLEFDVNTFYDNLSSTVAYYVYIMLGIYFDSYGQMGGDPFYAVAQSIAQTAASAGYKGWSPNDSQKARYWFMENHTNSAYQQLRVAYYYYHRLGLDLMTKDQPQARQNIIQALKEIQSVHKVRSNLLSVQQFIDVKMAEIVSIFTPAPATEQRDVYFIIKEVSPINVTKLKDWKVQ